MTEKVLAIIQARMGSTRLPGKVMRTIGQLEKPLIGLLISRLAKSTAIDEIILATSKNSENDPLCEYISSLGYAVFRGDEEDVLQRFCQASIAHQGDTIVRITGDSPLIDAQICDQLIEFHHLNDADYSYLSERFCEGVDCEVINIQSLVEANAEAKKPSEREHVTLYTYNHNDKYKCQKLENDSDDSCYRFTVDNIEDAQVVEHIINHFGNKIENVNTLQIKQYLLQHPKVNAINKDIIRNEGLLKSLAAEQANDINQSTK